MSNVSTITNRALELFDNPPLPAGSASKLGTYYNEVAQHMERRPDLMNTFKQARTEAGTKANTAYNDFFVNYDNRTTFDFVMQRLMPFWMYESRRWPRLIKIAAKRPVLAKYFTMIGGDWDYGYQPTPFGFEFHPAKGTLVSGLRRTLARDFPEIHGGFRGAVEEGLDWLGRGGFYFAPPITAANALLQGEPGGILPPPISLILHGLAAAGVELPVGFDDLAFNSRYTNFIIDQVIADTFKRNPTEIRRLVEAEDEESAAMFYTAKRIAALRIITLNQSSVLRYRPQSKREFIADSQVAVEELIGLSVDDQKDLRRLGISVYEIMAVSGLQRKAMREAIPNYDAWIGASISFRPLEEQRAIRTIDSFWAAYGAAQEDFEAEAVKLSARFERGDMNGPDARGAYSDLQQARGAIFESLRARPEFRDVPVTMEERQKYLARFNKPPQLVHPVDEVLEQYYRITPETFTDDVTGEVDWRLFFQTREELLSGVPEPVQSIVRDSLRKSNTPLERLLEIASPFIQAYYGIRSDLLSQIEQQDPNAGVAYREYRRQQNLAALAPDANTQRYHQRQAIAISSRNPILLRLESTVRLWREQFRREEPEMEAVFQMFIKRPEGLPTPRRVRILGGFSITPPPPPSI